MMTKKSKCSGLLCEMQAPFDTNKCECTDNCKNYIPLADTSGMEAVIDMAMKLFLIEKADRKKLEIMFGAYVTQYMAAFCRV